MVVAELMHTTRQIRSIWTTFRSDLPTKSKSLLGFRSRVLTYSGTVKKSAAALSMTYFGNECNLSFLLRSVFESHRPAVDLGRKYIWQASALLRDSYHKADVVVIDVPWPYDIDCDDSLNIMEVPSWVRQEVQLPEQPDQFFSGLHRSVRGEQMRKIRKHGLGYKVTQDPKAIREFYSTMYVPYIRRRFGETAALAPEKRLLSFARKGALLQVTHNREIIAGAVLIRSGDSLQSFCMGIRGTDKAIDSSATSALYFFRLSYAFQEGCRTIDFCGSRPLLTDGVFETKRRWGATVVDDFSLESLLIHPKNFGPGVQAFLRACPWIARQGDRLVGKVMLSGSATGTEAAQQDYGRLGCQGLDELQVFTPDGTTGIRGDSSRSTVPERIIDLRGVTDPLRAYCNGSGS